LQRALPSIGAVGTACPGCSFAGKDSFCKATLKVKTGDKVKVGTPVFEDNRNLHLTF
jgi:Na+-transporting NADH:ubiquinone oxidoreductase subunit NqrA